MNKVAFWISGEMKIHFIDCYMHCQHHESYYISVKQGYFSSTLCFLCFIISNTQWRVCIHAQVIYVCKWTGVSILKVILIHHAMRFHHSCQSKVNCATHTLCKAMAYSYSCNSMESLSEEISIFSTLQNVHMLHLQKIIELSEKLLNVGRK